MRVGLALVLVVGACGSPTSPGTVDGSMDGSGSADEDAAVDPWSLLVERAWQLPAGTPEAFRCRRIKVTEDTYITGFRMDAMAGAHHAIVTVSPGPYTTGEFNCDATEQFFEPQMLFAGGIGMDPLTFPAGVAYKVPANWYVMMQLHVDNRAGAATSGKASLFIKTAPASAVQHEADMVFLGNTNPNETIVANTTQPQDVLADCGAPQDWHIVGLIPHMHEVGVKMKIEETDGLNTFGVRLDATYTVGQQHSYPVDFLLPVNRRLKVTCLYVNTTSTNRVLGDTVFDEQCLAGMYRWPKQTGDNANKYSCVVDSI
jgi:hypothetical protein